MKNSTGVMALVLGMLVSGCGAGGEPVIKWPQVAQCGDQAPLVVVQVADVLLSSLDTPAKHERLVQLSVAYGTPVLRCVLEQAKREWLQGENAEHYALLIVAIDRFLLLLPEAPPAVIAPPAEPAAPPVAPAPTAQPAPVAPAPVP